MLHPNYILIHSTHAGQVSNAVNHGSIDSPNWYLEFYCDVCKTRHSIRQRAGGLAHAEITFFETDSDLAAARQKFFPCPVCKQPNRLTEEEWREGNQCDSCSDREDAYEREEEARLAERQERADFSTPEDH